MAYAQVSARGPTPNTGFVESSLGAHTVNSRKYVRVRPTLQLQEYTDIFALGDIIDWKEQKQITKAWGHAAIVAANVEAYLAGRKLKEYKGSPEMAMITNGKVRCLVCWTLSSWSDLMTQNGGVTFIGMLRGIVLGDWFTSMVKSKSLFISNARASVGQT